MSIDNKNANDNGNDNGNDNVNDKMQLPVFDEIVLSLGDKSCAICIERLNRDNFLIYRGASNLPWKLPLICQECFEMFLESQSEVFKTYVKNMTDLNHCSKSLTNLLSGCYGVPVYLQDLKIFPISDDLVVPNIIDPRFGRKCEITEVMISNSGRLVMGNSKIDGTPNNLDELREVLKQIILGLKIQLINYDVTDLLVSSTIDLVNKLEKELGGSV